jgi:hypothetical protein
VIATRRQVLITVLTLIAARFLSDCDINRSESLIDLTSAVVIAPGNPTEPENKAIAMLIEEVKKRTGIELQRANSWAADSTPLIAVGRAPALKQFVRDRVTAPEGYMIRVEKRGAAHVVFVIGSDARGVLFGVGRLLRAMHMSKGKVLLPNDLNISTAPRYALRGHQLGYRPKSNSYDGWTLPMWEQYIRDLAVFGTNAIELIPPRSDDAADSPHFPLPQMEMMTAMSRIADEYGLDVWIWYPAMDKDYSDPKTVDFALNEWSEVFKRLPRIDAVFVPGGDPGHTRPKHLMALLEKQAESLRRYHPRAQMWVSPQGFNKEWMNEFIAIVNSQPAWLGGIVYGPQTRLSLPELRGLIPSRYPIRHYPDITHTRHCQYPVPDWDLAYAFTEGREPINPRPLDQAHIFRLLQKHTIGFITYSEGCNDDVNKIVWSALGWDEQADLTEVLREYGRYFIGPAYAEAMAQGLLALERNWRGPLLTNSGVYTTLQQFQALERSASPQDLLNWRFQQALYRAYYDAYLRSRLIYETSLEDEAMSKLRDATRVGSLTAMSQAEAVLDKAVTEPVSTDWRARVFELAEALYQSIRMQLSVKRYKAIATERGANLDSIDLPLNNRLWLKQEFDEIRKLAAEADRLKRIEEIVNWTNPGPGGFYDDLGNLSLQPHLVRGPGFEKDPSFFESSLVFFERVLHGRTSWWDQAIALYDAALRMHYSGLDPSAQYKLRVVYGGDRIRLVADERFEVHPFISKKYQVVEFDIPREATADGDLDLSWYREPGAGGAGRGCQVAEVWLIRQHQ